MFSLLEAPLSNPAAYWKRLELQPETASGDFEHDLKLLDALICAHQKTIAFECMDSRFSLAPIDLSIPALEEKVMQRGRGGYCFELNALFTAFLKHCGFTVRPVMARIVRMATGPLSPMNHYGIVVDLQGHLRYADVGFGGPMAACSLPLAHNAIVPSERQEFQVSQLDQLWWLISYRKAGSTEDFIHVCKFQQEACLPSDFLPLSWYAETHPDSVFKNTLLLNRRTEDGNVSLRETCFTKTQNGVTSKKEISFGALAELLETEFLVTPPPQIKALGTKFT